jgi:hypothetical protein
LSVKKNSSSPGRRKRKKRPSTAGALRKSASSSVAASLKSRDSNVRTSFPPVKRGGSSKSSKRNNEEQENSNNGGWMQTSSNEVIQPYDALADRFCPLYKPSNLVKGKAAEKGSPQYKMKKWREKYNKELRQSMKEVMMEGGGRGEMEDEDDEGGGSGGGGGGGHRRENAQTSSSTSPPTSSDHLHEEASFPFPGAGEEGSLLMFQPTASTVRGALTSSGHGSSNSKRTSNITFAKTPTMDETTRNRIRGGGGGGGGAKQHGTSSSSHSQHEVQVVKSILHRERLVQMLRDAVGLENMMLERPHRGGGPLGVSLDYPKIFSLLDRVRLATVETIEAMQTGVRVRVSHESDESGSFIWHTKNYMLELLTDLDRTVSVVVFFPLVLSFFLLSSFIFFYLLLSSFIFFLLT